MGLTGKSTGASLLGDELAIDRSGDEKVIALAGNPNVGKSTVFNALTGLKQHTGNWPGKTVANAWGKYKYKDRSFILVDIPGTYSLMASSVEEEIARDFICFGDPDACIVVADATCLERNLNLVLQTLEICPNVVVCVNLMDEAKRKKINIDLDELSRQLGVEVIGTSARSGQGLDLLMDAVYRLSCDEGSSSTAISAADISCQDISCSCISCVKKSCKCFSPSETSSSDISSPDIFTTDISSTDISSSDISPLGISPLVTSHSDTQSSYTLSSDISPSNRSYPDKSPSDRASKVTSHSDKASSVTLSSDISSLEMSPSDTLSSDTLSSDKSFTDKKAHILSTGSSSGFKIDYGAAIEEAIAVLEPSVENLLAGRLNSRWVALRLIEADDSLLNSLKNYLNLHLLSDDNIKDKLAKARKLLEEAGMGANSLRDLIVSCIVKKAEEISKRTIIYENEQYNSTDRKIDKILTSRIYGIPIMIALLGFIFWLTISGANYPSALLAKGLFWLEERLYLLFEWAGAPAWLSGLLVSGCYRTLAWVVSVMLPPMAIFFPLFTLLEDLGYLPRVAFNLDNYFRKACAHGKQSLSMCMGFGCNAAGIIGCRIIDSPRERLIAILTNNFVPCNGRFPTLIAIITMFFASAAAGPLQTIASTLILTAIIVLGVIMTLLTSRLLSKTILKGMPSSFALELPPYRKPQIGRIIVRSVFDRTLFVLGRAVAVAAPAGMLIWIMANVKVADQSLLSHLAAFLDPFARLIGLDGFIIMAFLLGFPANEIVIPIIIMSYMATGSLVELDNLSSMKELLLNNGWTWLTAVCMMLFCLMHWPCSTSCLTIKKESGSWKWTGLAFIIPTIAGITVCFIISSVARLLGLV